MPPPMSEAHEFADEGIAAFVAASSFGPMTLESLAGLREGAAQRAASRPRGPELAEVRDLEAPREHARLYRPFAGPEGPLVLWLHGGGWAFGDADTHDRASRRLAAGSGVAVLTLDYRLAPDDPYPAAVEDAVAALEWLAGAPDELGFTPTRIGVGGDSAGGLLAALACLRIRDAGSAALPDLQVLVYGNTDLTCERPSTTQKATGYGLEKADEEFFDRLWLPDESRWGDPDVSPLHADLAGLPEALVITAEHDILRDQGQAYADKLRAAGVAVTYRCEPQMIHNFMIIDLLSPAAAAAGDRLAHDVGVAMAPDTRVQDRG